MAGGLPVSLVFVLVGAHPEVCRESRQDITIIGGGLILGSVVVSKYKAHQLPPAARLSTTTTAASLYPESQWKTETARYSQDAEQSHASVVSAGTGTGRGNHSGRRLLWLSFWPKHGGRH